MPETTPPLSDAMMARALFGGKKTVKLEFRCTDDLAEAVRRRVIDLGFESASEYLDFIASIDCWGIEHVRIMRDRPLAMVRSLSDVVQTGGAA